MPGDPIPIFVTVGGMLGVAVIILGLKLRHSHADDNDEALDWGYFAAVAASGGCVLAGCLLSLLLCFVDDTAAAAAEPARHEKHQLT